MLKPVVLLILVGSFAVTVVACGDVATLPEWTGTLKGKKYADKGVMLKLEPGRTLQYSPFSALSGKPDIAENYHIVTIGIIGSENKTAVSLSQDNNRDEAAHRESEKNWGKMLASLKQYVEEQS
jgi:Activator of Hsp90 ATPase homolog 1-like protein